MPLFVIGIIPFVGPGGMFASFTMNLFHIIGVTSEALTKEQALKDARITNVLEYGSPQEQETTQWLIKTDSHEAEWIVVGCLQSNRSR